MKVSTAFLCSEKSPQKKELKFVKTIIGKERGDLERIARKEMKKKKN